MLLKLSFKNVVIIIRSKNNLAKFGYILDMKVERKKESLYILGYLLELIIKIWQFGFFILDLTNLDHLLHEFFLIPVKIINFQFKIHQ